MAYMGTGLFVRMVGVCERRAGWVYIEGLSSLGLRVPASVLQLGGGGEGAILRIRFLALNGISGNSIIRIKKPYKE